MSVSASPCELFRLNCEPVWESLRTHPFIRELAAGTLALEKFRFFLEQNLMYLPGYARAMAIGAARTDDLGLARYFSRALANVLESEIPENEELLGRVLALGAPDCRGATAMAPANVAYTGFLVSTAFRYGPAEIMAAVTPCTWSYGDIASSLEEAAAHPIYADWVSFYGSADYAEIVADMNERLNVMAAGLRDSDLRLLSDLFRTSVRLERAFWSMAYNCEQWPDVGP